MNKIRVFMTGGTGKIGKRLIEKMDLSKYDVYVLCRNKEHELIPLLKVVLGDLAESESYSSVFKNKIDIVVHMGAITHTNNVSKYYKINAEATSELIKLCESSGIKKFVFISTRAISDKGGHYSRSKAMAETYVRQSGLKWVIMRMAEVYGIPGGEGVDLVLDRIKNMPIVPIIGNGEYSIAPVHVSDAVSVIIRAIEKDGINNKLYNVAGPENFTYNEFIDRILKLSGLRKIKIHIPVIFVSVFLRIYAAISKSESLLVMDQLPRLLSNKSYDISEAFRDLDFKPLSLENFIGKDERI